MKRFLQFGAQETRLYGTLSQFVKLKVFVSSKDRLMAKYPKQSELFRFLNLCATVILCSCFFMHVNRILQFFCNSSEPRLRRQQVKYGWRRKVFGEELSAVRDNEKPQPFLVIVFYFFYLKFKIIFFVASRSLSLLRYEPSATCKRPKLCRLFCGFSNSECGSRAGPNRPMFHWI